MLLNPIIMQQKLHYTAPKAERLVVQSEAVICQSVPNPQIGIGGFGEDPNPIDFGSSM